MLLPKKGKSSDIVTAEEASRAKMRGLVPSCEKVKKEEGEGYHIHDIQIRTRFD
jgi:hypothetical protein